MRARDGDSFNENLVFASQTANDPVISALFGSNSEAPIRPGARNEFHAGFQQALGRFLVVDADYMWKYTHNAYDFSTLLDTPSSSHRLAQLQNRWSVRPS